MVRLRRKPLTRRVRAIVEKAKTAVVKYLRLWRGLAPFLAPFQPAKAAKGAGGKPGAVQETVWFQAVVPEAIFTADAQKRVPPLGERGGRAALPRDLVVGQRL